MKKLEQITRQRGRLIETARVPGTNEDEVKFKLAVIARHKRSRRTRE